MTNPKATLHMANGADIVIELLPEAAPNTVNSFIYAASHGYLDHHAIERIVPGNWVDVSYTAFGHKELQYLIPNEFALNPDVTPLDSHPGCVCMGGYGEAGLASCEFFFPLRDCPDHKGTYPVFGKVISNTIRNNTQSDIILIFSIREHNPIDSIIQRTITTYNNNCTITIISKNFG